MRIRLNCPDFLLHGIHQDEVVRHNQRVTLQFKDLAVEPDLI
jgi:hypothetical protein